MRTTSVALPLLLGLTLCIGCSDDGASGTPDAALADAAGQDRASGDTGTNNDGTMPDRLRVDMARVDARPREASAPDNGGQDMPRPDSAMADASQPDTALTPDSAAAPDSGSTAPTVLYMTGPYSTTMTARRIKTDGTGAAAVPNLPALFDLYAMSLGGVREYCYVNRHKVQDMNLVDNYYQPFQLPGKQGLLYMLKSSSGYSYVQVWPDGTVKVLDTKAGTSIATSSFYTTIGFKDDASMFAATYGYNSKTNAGIKPIRTDGKKFSGNASGVCDITPASPKVYYYRYFSFLFGGNKVWFIAVDVTNINQYYLFWAPDDCTAKATLVTLPKVSGSAPVALDNYMRLSDDGKYITLNGGVSSSKEDILLIDTASGGAVNFTESPADYISPGYYIYYYSSTGIHTAISPGSKNMAYVKSDNSGYELYVRPLNKSKAAVHVTRASNFAAALDDAHNLFWASDDDLTFWAGASVTAADMFHYKVSTGALTNLTKSGGTTKPFSSTGNLRAYSGWVSPNGKHLYIMLYKSSTDTNIRALELSTLTFKEITKGMYVHYGHNNLESTVGATNLVFFGGKKTGSSTHDLFVFDQNTASKPVKLTKFSGAINIYDIMPSSDGKLVAFGAGPASTKQDMYVARVNAGGTPTVTKLSTTQGYVMDMKLFTPGNKAVVWGSSSTVWESDLRVSTVDGKQTKMLDPIAQYTSVMAVY